MVTSASRLLVAGESCLLMQPSLLKKLGKSKALFLQQLHFWLSNDQAIGKIHDGARWIYNTSEEWGRQLYLSERHVRRIVHELRDLGYILIDTLSLQKSDRTYYYTINYDMIKTHFGIDLFQGSSISKSSATDNLVQTENFEKGRGDNNAQTNTSDQNFCDKMSVSSGQDDRLFNTNNTFKEKTNKSYDVHEMLLIWNQTVTKADVLNKSLARQLMAAFKTKFDSSLENWKLFCDSIQSSDYLTGEKFKLSLYWVLKFSTIDRIKNGEFGVKSGKIITSSHIPHVDKQAQAEAHIQSVQEDDFCKTLRKQFLIKHGVDSYLSWMTKVSFVHDVDKTCVKIISSSAFVSVEIERRFGGQWLQDK